MIITDLKKIHNALNQIEVKGESNIACMFVALSNLTKIMQELEGSQNQEEKKEEK